MSTRKQSYHQRVAALSRPSLAMRRYSKCWRRQMEHETDETADATQAAYRALTGAERALLMQISRSLDTEYSLG